MSKRVPPDGDDPFNPSIEEVFGPPADDAVGYGRPPKAAQFKKGHSGNPKGRPKRKVSSGLGGVAQEIRALLDRQVSIRTGDKAVRMTLLNAVIRAFVGKAARGDQRAMRTLLAEQARLDPPQQEPVGYLVVPRESLIMEEFDARYERTPGHTMRPRTVEEARAYLKEIGRAPAPLHVVISGQEKEPLIIDVPEHLRPYGSS